MKPEITSYSDIRTELARLQARYDSGAVPVIRKLETELSWLEHGGRHK